jgi:cell division protein FtsI (penicillin-binding protein 3)
MVIVWMALEYHLFAVQVTNAESYSESSLAQRQKQVVLAADRGTIFDRNGREIAVTIDAVTVFANPRLIEDVNVTAQLVSTSLGLDFAETLEGLQRDSSFAFLSRQREETEIETLRNMELPGIFFESEPKRVYPAGSMAAQVIGFVDIDGVGIEGLEAFYDEALAGTPGSIINEQDPKGRPIPQGAYEIIPATSGTDLITTIDTTIQFMAEQACLETIERTSAAACSMVVLDPATGEVLAMVVVPTFDPGNRTTEDIEAFQNRTVRYVFEPGSTQKLVTVAAAIEENTVTWNTSFNVPYSIDVYDQNFTEYGNPRDDLTLSVKDIVTSSSNVGTILIQQELGDDLLREYLDRFGYGQLTGIDFHAEATGTVNLDPSCGSCGASAAIGYSVTATPLQMASVYGTVANDGKWIQPHLVTEVVDGDGILVPIIPETRTVVSPETAQTMRYLLRNVVDEGTGQRAQVPGYSVGGKTGTSNIAVNGQYTSATMASFIGMAPIENPKLVIAVVIDSPVYGNTGGQAAAPAFADVMEKALHHLGIEPDAS